MLRAKGPQTPKCDVVVCNNDEVLLIADDPAGFAEGVPLQIARNGVITALRNRRCVIVGRIPEPINGYARNRGEVLFRCNRTGRTALLAHPGREKAA